MGRLFFRAASSNGKSRATTKFTPQRIQAQDHRLFYYRSTASSWCTYTLNSCTYQFDTYRVTYRYRFHKSEKWIWSWGGTLLVRDAKIALEQEGQHASKSNVGVVPLLHLSGVWRMTPQWRTLMEMDGLAGGPGRAIDATVQSFYQTSDRWEFGGGYRTIEGGSDTDAVYTFAWFHVFTLSINYRFN